MKRGGCSFCVRERRRIEIKCVFRGVVLVKNRIRWVMERKNRTRGVGGDTQKINQRFDWGK